MRWREEKLCSPRPRPPARPDEKNEINKEIIKANGAQHTKKLIKQFRTRKKGFSFATPKHTHQARAHHIIMAGNDMIYVAGLPDTVTETDLSGIFGSIGQLKFFYLRLFQLFYCQQSESC